MHTAYRLACTALLGLAGTWFACAGYAADANYTVSADAELNRFDVRACFPDRLPAALVAYDAQARRYLAGMTVTRNDMRRALQPRGPRVPLPGRGTDGCVDYTVALDSTPTATRHRGIHRVGRDLVFSPHLLIWYPESRDMTIELAFDLPAGVRVSAPWPRAADAVFHPGERLPDWDARIALGYFDVDAITMPGGTVELAITGDLPVRKRDGLRDWITQGAQALVDVSGRLPVPRLQVLVVPLGRGGEPVPWGEVQRGGGDAVHLFIDERRPIAEFHADWTLVHELSHLLHPPLDVEGRWFSEGVASYYQNTLRARTGMLSPIQAWRKLHAGFERGRNATLPDLSLLEASEHMMRDRAFQRVYWSGAAIALLADVELRRRSGGAKSLDTAMAALQACCLPAQRQWSSVALMTRLDAMSGTDVFTRLYSRHARASEFPDLRPVYAHLGLEVQGGKLHTHDHAAGARLRRDVMQ